MPMKLTIEQLLQCLIHVVARAALPEEKVREVVGTGAKQLRAFDLADGTRSQKDIRKETGIDQGQLSNTFKRWVQCGAAFWIGDGNDRRPMHVYPLSAKALGKKPRKTSRKRRARRG